MTADARQGAPLWGIQRFDQLLGTYSNLEAARDHGDHVIRDHYQHADRNRVPKGPWSVDWRAACCGHLFGPGCFNHTAYPEVHKDGCWQPVNPGSLVLRPFCSATGGALHTGHVTTDWQIWEGVALDRFDASGALTLQEASSCH